MSLIQAQHWELRLLSSAREALNSQRLIASVHADSNVLDKVYQHCDVLTREHSRTFFLASALLPPEKRQAARALYAFCRVTDDIVDDPKRTVAERKLALERWRVQVMEAIPTDNAPVCIAWMDTQGRFNIPRGYAQQLIEGCGRDIVQTRYETFADLAEYAYGVASTVGLMAMHIIGFQSEDALHYAVRLGVALQLTNILRDVAEDWHNGRVYLPQHELQQFGLTEVDIANGIVDDRWRKFMAFQIERNRKLYDESLAGIALLDKSGRFAIRAAAELYKDILDDIETHDYDVFSHRAHIGTMQKLMRLPGIWWRSRTVALQ
jgi:15-cis-phytoene synthase